MPQVIGAGLNRYPISIGDKALPCYSSDCVSKLREGDSRSYRSLNNGVISNSLFLIVAIVAAMFIIFKLTNKQKNASTRHSIRAVELAVRLRAGYVVGV